MSRRPPRKEGAALRMPVTMTCSQCQTRNYRTTKKPDKPLQLKKFCKVCATHTVHVAEK